LRVQGKALHNQEISMILAPVERSPLVSTTRPAGIGKWQSPKSDRDSHPPESRHPPSYPLESRGASRVVSELSPGVWGREDLDIRGGILDFRGATRVFHWDLGAQTNKK
jgi:hypothetical protein